ncbi:MAG TPA: hypothetical protein VH592_12635 [Gemmataceae bacterium]
MFWHLKLAERGKDTTRFPTALASSAAHAEPTVRHFCGQKRANEVPSPVAQQQHHFALRELPVFEPLAVPPVSEVRHDKTQSPPDEIVCLNLDFASKRAS